MNLKRLIGMYRMKKMIEACNLLKATKLRSEFRILPIFKFPYQSRYDTHSKNVFTPQNLLLRIYEETLSAPARTQEDLSTCGHPQMSNESDSSWTALGRDTSTLYPTCPTSTPPTLTKKSTMTLRAE